jgi:Domain of unknown function (DUF4282)
MPGEKGFWGSLFDFSFSSLVTTKIIKVLYILAMIVIGLGAIVYIVVAFTSSVALGVLTLFVFAPIAVVLYLIWTRVVLEVIIVLFRILETNREIVINTSGGRPAGAAAPAANAETTSGFTPPASSGPPPPPPAPGA